nr:serine/threonine-protein kinase EDR1-like isoform X1 [Ipomoea batatas]
MDEMSPLSLATTASSTDLHSRNHKTSAGNDGFFGEVFHGIWNGTKVVIKVFLLQDLTVEDMEDFCNEISILSHTSLLEKDEVDPKQIGRLEVESETFID